KYNRGKSDLLERRTRSLTTQPLIMSSTPSPTGSHPNYHNTWQNPPPLKRMHSMTLQSYQPKIISETRRKIEDLCRDLIVNNDHIHVVERRIRKAINEGISKKHHETSSVKCFPTFETGRFLALDLGGTNFRVLVVDIGENKKFEMDSQVFPIPNSIMIGTGEGLFDHIADCCKKFVYDRKLENDVLPMGFTFSFATQQEGLAKGFKCSGVEGEDVVQLLKVALDKKKLKIDVCAILNDTTGESKCRIGLIIGTGTNACYLEDLENVERFDGDRTQGPQHMIVNTEWGNFGSIGELDFIRTKWDEAVDAVLVDMIWEGLMFKEQANTDLLFEWGRFYTRYVSEIESDPVGSYQRAREVCIELGLEIVTEEDLSALRYICECVSRRAGFMASAGITALLKKMDYHDVVVAIDGSVFRYHPHFSNIMKSRISQLMGVDYKFDLMMSTDGSGRGAALVAAVLTNE
ncbi:Phosphotransferase, partial [Caligus rogercresseyi]